MGINTAVVYSALASGPFIGGMITHHWSWQSLFLIVGAVGVLVAIGAVLFLKGEWIESKGERFDYVGSIIYAIGLFGLMFGFSKLPDAFSFVWISLGVTSFIIFAFYELKQKQPVFNIRIFSGNKAFSFSSLSALINYSSTSAVAFMMSLYLRYVREYDAHHAGLILIVQASTQCIVSLCAGILSNKINPSILATLGMGISAVGLLGLVFLSSSTSLIFIIFLLTLLGLGFGLFSSPNTNVIMSSVEKKQLGQASATMGTMRLTGQAFSMGIAMMALSLYVGDQMIVPEVYPSFMKSLHITFTVCTVLCIFGTYASSFRVRKSITH